MSLLYLSISILLISGFGMPFAEGIDKPSGTAEEIRNNNPSGIEEKKAESTPKEESVKTEVESAKKEGEGKPSEESQKDLKKDNIEQNKNKSFEYRSYNSFGLNISSHSGIGLSYRYHMEAPLLFQVTGGVVSGGGSYFYAVGAEVQKELSKSKDKRAFGSFATGIYGERYKEKSVEYYTGMIPPEKWVTQNAYSFALGVGGELAFGNSIIDSLTIGCEIYPIGIYIEDSGDSKFNMFPGGAIYLFYNF